MYICNWNWKKKFLFLFLLRIAQFVNSLKNAPTSETWVTDVSGVWANLVTGLDPRGNVARCSTPCHCDRRTFHLHLSPVECSANDVSVVDARGTAEWLRMLIENDNIFVWLVEDADVYEHSHIGGFHTGREFSELLLEILLTRTGNIKRLSTFYAPFNVLHRLSDIIISIARTYILELCIKIDISVCWRHLAYVYGELHICRKITKPPA